MRLAPLSAIALLLAGCAGQAPEPAPPAVVEAEGPKWLHFEQTYDLMRTEVQTPAGSAGRGAGNGNCLMLDDDALVNGTATVTWDAASTDPEMELVLSGPDDLAFRTGSGEIALEFSGFRVEGQQFGGSPLVWQVSESAAAGVVYEKAATLVLVLDVLLDDPEDEFKPDDNWSCSVGH